MTFNGYEVDGRVNGVSMDWGRTVAVVAKDGSAQDLQDRELFAFRLEPPQQAGLLWSEEDTCPTCLLVEGKRLVRFARGSAQSGPGALLVAVDEENAAQRNWYVYGWQGTQPLASRASASPINGIAISDGTSVGHTVAVVSDGTGTAPPGRNQTSIYTYSGGAIQHVTNFTVFSQVGTVAAAHAVDISSSGRFVVVGATRHVAAPAPAGAVYLFDANAAGVGPNNPAPALLSRETHNQWGNMTSPIRHVAIAGDGRYFVAADEASPGRVYLCTNRHAINEPWVRCDAQFSVEGRITALAISFHGNNFAVGTDAGDVYTWRINRDDRSNAQNANAGDVGSSATPLGPWRGAQAGSRAAISSLAYSFNGQWLVAGGTHLYGFVNSTIDPVWQLPLVVPGTGGAVVASPVLGVAISHDGQRIVAVADQPASGGTPAKGRVFAFQQSFGVDLSADPASRTTQPGSVARYLVTVRNTGSNADNFRLEVIPPTQPRAWSATLNATTVALPPGRDVRLFLNVTVPDDVLPETYITTVRAESLGSVAAGGSSVASSSVAVPTVVGRVYGVEVTPRTQETVVNPGERRDVRLTLRNTGNGEDTIRFAVTAVGRSPGTEWATRLEPDGLVTIPAFGTREVLLEVRSIRAADGDFVDLSFVAEASRGEVGIRDTAKVLVRVNPRFGGSVEIERTDLLLAPGEAAVVNLTVENHGNTRDVFRIENRTEPRNPVGWRLSLSSQTVVLDRLGDKGVVRLRVTAPSAAQAGDEITIFVDVFSQGEEGRRVDQKSLVARVGERGGGFLGLPGFEPLLLVVGALGAVVVLRRGGRG